VLEAGAVADGAVGWVMIARFVLASGWVEDIAARARPRLLP
jgi:hypothetical protein